MTDEIARVDVQFRDLQQQNLFGVRQDEELM